MITLLLLLILSLHIYLPWRLGKLFSLKSRIWLYILFVVGYIANIVLIPIMTRYDNVPVSIYYDLASTWFGIFLYLSCFTVIFEVVNLIHKLSPVKAGWAIIILTVLVSIYSFLNALSFKTVYVTVPVKNLENEVKIAHISDLHLIIARDKNYLEKIVKRVNKLNPDFVVITGDIADGRAVLNRNMFAILKDLQSPVYFVHGNHDVYLGLNEIIKGLRENNVTVMQNEVLTVNGIKLIGLNYMKADDKMYDPHELATDETVKDILPALDLSGDNPKIVLHHAPWGIEYMNEHGVDLVLASHTHGGQIFPVTIIAKMKFPYIKGLAKYKGTYIYVSGGTGTFLPRMRLGTNNEIALITLEPMK